VSDRALRKELRAARDDVDVRSRIEVRHVARETPRVHHVVGVHARDERRAAPLEPPRERAPDPCLV